MYVKLFDGRSTTATVHSGHRALNADSAEMIQTVLASESYLFTPREIWVLRYILGLSCRSS